MNIRLIDSVTKRVVTIEVTPDPNEGAMEFKHRWEEKFRECEIRHYEFYNGVWRVVYETIVEENEQ